MWEVLEGGKMDTQTVEGKVVSLAEKLVGRLGFHLVELTVSYLGILKAVKRVQRKVGVMAVRSAENWVKEKAEKKDG